MTQFKYLAISDGGDGDISWCLLDNQEELDQYISENDYWEESYFAVLKIDFVNQTVKHTVHCQ